MDPAKAKWRVGVQRVVDHAGFPVQATPGSSGYDLSSGEDSELSIEPGHVGLVRTGIALELPPGLEGQVRSRSGLAAKHNVFVLNSPGTIDSDYRGEVKVVLANFGQESFVVAPGDRIAQLVFIEVPQVRLVAVNELAATERGSQGFGSSGNGPMDSTCEGMKAASCLSESSAEHSETE